MHAKCWQPSGGTEFLKHGKTEPITEPNSGKTLPLFFGYVAEVKRWRKYQKQTQKQDTAMHKDTYERTVTGSLVSALKQRTSAKGDTAMVDR